MTKRVPIGSRQRDDNWQLLNGTEEYAALRPVHPGGSCVALLVSRDVLPLTKANGEQGMLGGSVAANCSLRPDKPDGRRTRTKRTEDAEKEQANEFRLFAFFGSTKPKI